MLNVPNLVTIVRTVAAIVLAVAASAEASAALAVAAFACYWVGDVLDGLSARLLAQETRAGAVLDIVADRACCSLCAGALLVLLPEMALPVGIFMTQFLVLDCLLSLSFLYWPVLSPNYFGLVHRGVYWWNWSPPAKAINTGGVVVLVLAAPSPLWPAAFALAVTVVKLGSLVTVGRLRVAEQRCP
jgi:phosphatidylglycerophosphate synthase